MMMFLIFNVFFPWTLVTAPPTFIVKPQDKKVGLNGVALFPCVADGNPPPSVFWKKEGYSTLMFPNNSYGHLHVSLEGTLQINGAQKDDAGYYVCSALSVVDSTTIRAFLQVRASTAMTTTTAMSNLWQTRSCSGNDSNTHPSMHTGYSGCVCCC